MAIPIFPPGYEHDVDINCEFNNALKWAEDNRMIVNLRKLKKLFFTDPQHVIRYFLVTVISRSYLLSCVELPVLIILSLIHGQPKKLERVGHSAIWPHH